MITKQTLTEIMINLATALRENDPDLYYYYAECLRYLHQYANENGIDICEADLWW